MTSVEQMAGRLFGVVPPMVTPLAGGETVDVEGLERLVEHILAGGVHGLFVLGTCGEGPSLSQRLKREVVARACACVRGRVPVLVGATDASPAESRALSRYAADQGADAVVLAPPYYFPIGQAELVAYYRAFADASPLPVVPYNIPSCTKVHLEVDTVRLLLDHANVIGFKDSSGQMVYLQELVRVLRAYPDKGVLVGPEEMLGAAALAGACGGVPGGANLFPKLYAGLYEAAHRRDLAGVQRCQRLVLDVAASLYGVARAGPSVVVGLKGALSCLGICGARMAEPFQGLDDERVRIIRERVEELSLRIEAQHRVPAPGPA